MIGSVKIKFSNFCIRSNCIVHNTKFIPATQSIAAFNRKFSLTSNISKKCDEEKKKFEAHTKDMREMKERKGNKKQNENFV